MGAFVWGKQALETTMVVQAFLMYVRLLFALHFSFFQGTFPRLSCFLAADSFEVADVVQSHLNGKIMLFSP